MAVPTAVFTGPNKARVTGLVRSRRVGFRPARPGWRWIRRPRPSIREVAGDQDSRMQFPINAAKWIDPMGGGVSGGLVGSGTEGHRSCSSRHVAISSLIRGRRSVPRAISAHRVEHGECRHRKHLMSQASIIGPSYRARQFRSDSTGLAEYIESFAPLVGLVAWLLISGCGSEEPSKPSSDPVVAEVDGRVIRSSRLEWEVRRRSGDARNRVDPRMVLDEMVDLEAAYSKASRSGFLETPEMTRAMMLMVVQRYREQREQLHPAVPALDAERVSEVYRSQSDRFTRPPMVNLAVIRVEIPRKAAPEKRFEALAKSSALIDRAHRELPGIGNFGSLAAEVSSDQSTRYRGGELGWISIEELSKRLPPEVAKAGLSLAKEGEISAPVAAEDGFYLLRLVGRRGPILRPLDEVRPQIEHELILESKRRSERAWAEESRSGLRIRIDEEVLGRVKQPIPAPPPAPPRPMLQP